MKLATIAVSFYLGSPTFKNEERLRTEYPRRDYPAGGGGFEGAEAVLRGYRTCPGRPKGVYTPAETERQRLAYGLHPRRWLRESDHPCSLGHDRQNHRHDWGDRDCPALSARPEANHHVGTALIDSVLDDVQRKIRMAGLRSLATALGENFALNIVNHRHRQGKALPDQVICFAPCIDLSMASSQNNPRPTGSKRQTSCWGEPPSARQ